MKKILFLAMALASALALAACANDDSVDEQIALYQAAHKSNEARFPVYIDGSHALNMSIHFLNGVDDIPYIEACDMVDLFGILFGLYDRAPKMSYSARGSVFTCVRKSEAYKVNTAMTIDFDRDVIRFDDYNIFTMLPCRSTILDVTSMPFYDEQTKKTRLIKRVEPKYLPRLGPPLEIDLAKYGIDLVVRDGKYLLPMQTASDILIAPTFLGSLYFNGQAVILAADMAASPDPAAPNVNRELYYKGKKGERSAALVQFGYNELCMALDTLYGLKDLHDIESFDQLFQNQGAVSMNVSKSLAQRYSLKSYLTGSSVFDADLAIYHLIGDFFDDNHSKWYNFSYLAGEHDEYKPNGASRERLDEFKAVYKNARDKAYPSGVPPYQEVGDTAYITFDAFVMRPDFYKDSAALDGYYTADLEQYCATDTIALVMYAHSKITRDDSPIKNVVIDLSVNGGGSADVAVFVASWFLGEMTLSMKFTTTGAYCVTNYRCDANRDYKYDEKDTLSGKRLFCLVSPFSFSCANLVPSLFKESEKVTLLGRTSGGGACVVQPISSAWGTSFRISGPQRLCSMKNGSYYDIDRGAEPDYYIADPETHFDRAALNGIIAGLK